MTHERRNDHETRELIERAAEAAATKALQKFAELTPWDLSSKEGREQARATIAHADLLRSGCDTIKQTGWKTVLRGIAWIGILAFVFGTLYILGIDPTKLRLTNGGR